MKTAAELVAEAAKVDAAMRAKAEDPTWLTPVEEVELEETAEQGEPSVAKQDPSPLDEPDATIEHSDTRTDMENTDSVRLSDSPLEEIPVVGEHSAEVDAELPVEADQEIRAIENEDFEISLGDSGLETDMVSENPGPAIEPGASDAATTYVNSGETVENGSETELPFTRENDLEPVGIDFDGNIKPIGDLDEPVDTGVEASELPETDDAPSLDQPVDSPAELPEPGEAGSQDEDEPDTPRLDDAIEEPGEEVEQPAIGRLDGAPSRTLETYEPDQPVIPDDEPYDYGDTSLAPVAEIQSPGLESPEAPEPSGLIAVNNLPPKPLSQVNQLDFLDPSAPFEEQINQQFEMQIKSNEDLAERLAQELGPKFDELRDFQAQTVHDFIDRQIMVQQFLADEGA